MKTVSWKMAPSPFLVTRPTISKMSLITGISLVPHLLIMLIQGDIPSLVSIFAAILGSIIAELCVSFSRKKQALGDGTAILSGMLIGFLLPFTIPPFIVLFTSFFGCLVARAIFGGTGTYWMNPVAVAVCIAYLSQGNLFPPLLVTPESVGAAGNVFGALKLDQFSRISVDPTITKFLNYHVLQRFSISLPEGYITLFWQSPSVIPAFRYNLLTLFASVVLLSLKIIDWIVPATFLATYAIFVYFFTPLAISTGIASGDILFAFLTGGILFTAFFLLPEYSTTPRTRIGKFSSGFCAGIIAFFLCGLGGSSVGAVFTVVSVNPINTIIEYVEKQIVALRRNYP
ncbi:MAG TPA: RnfABCDGE type electron transport complex subunit D [Treponema sp.]|nr:RnfABCDGE type electron transport complex subunit D [Treponema sp.]